MLNALRIRTYSRCFTCHSMRAIHGSLSATNSGSDLLYWTDGASSEGFSAGSGVARVFL